MFDPAGRYLKHLYQFNSLAFHKQNQIVVFIDSPADDLVGYNVIARLSVCHKKIDFQKFFSAKINDLLISGWPIDVH
jgi:hypothetical protein